ALKRAMTQSLILPPTMITLPSLCTAMPERSPPNASSAALPSPSKVASRPLGCAAASSSTIVRIAVFCGPNCTQPPGCDSSSSTVSSPSAFGSSAIGISTTRGCASPSAKKTVTFTGSKSLSPVAVPPMVVKVALTRPLLPPVRVMVTVGGASLSGVVYVAALNCKTPAPGFEPHGSGGNAIGGGSKSSAGASTCCSPFVRNSEPAPLAEGCSKLMYAPAAVGRSLGGPPRRLCAWALALIRIRKDSPTSTEDRSTLNVSG